MLLIKSNPRRSRPCEQFPIHLGRGNHRTIHLSFALIYGLLHLLNDAIIVGAAQRQLWASFTSLPLVFLL